MLFNNHVSTKETKIKLNDIDAPTFECIRDWCYCNSSLHHSITNENVFGVIVASFKYQIETLLDQCINYTRNEWIKDGESLIDFIDKVQKYDDEHNNPTLIHQLPSIFNKNRIFELDTLCETKF